MRDTYPLDELVNKTEAMIDRHLTWECKYVGLSQCRRRTGMTWTAINGLLR